MTQKSLAKTSPYFDAATILNRARTVLAIEGQAVQNLQSRLDGGFVQACQLLLACTGRVVVSGMGKSGHIAHKIAATLASTAVAAEGPGLGADAIDDTLNTIRRGDAKPSGQPAGGQGVRRRRGAPCHKTVTEQPWTGNAMRCPTFA